MGSATLEPQGAFEAGSMQSFTLVYTAGAFGVDDTGSIKIGFRFATDFGPVQFTDPKAPGYTTVEASNGATLEAKWEFKRNIRPWSRSLYIGVVKDFLDPGDTITVRFGDRARARPASACRPIARVSSSFACSPIRSPPTTTWRFARARRSRSCRARGCTGTPCCRRWCARASPSAFDQGRRQVGQSVRPASTARCSSEAERPVAGLPETLRFVPGSFGAVADGLELSQSRAIVMHPRTRRGRQRAVPLKSAARGCPQARRSSTSGATRTASPTRRSAPTRRATISCSAATRPSST